jgi:hypothetical protein
MDLDDLKSNVVKRFEHIIQGLQTSTVARQEAITQVKNTAQKKRDKQLVKELAKNY